MKPSTSSRVARNIKSTLFVILTLAGAVMIPALIVSTNSSNAISSSRAYTSISEPGPPSTQTRKLQKKSPVPQAPNAQAAGGPNAPSAVTITATMTDNVTPNTTKVLPGSTINYTVVINSTGTTDAAAVAFNDVIDPNTTLVAGSVHASPVALNDSYNWVGNTFLDSNARALPSVLANDTISSSPDTIVVTTLSGAATALGGAVTLGANGHFMYTPPLGRPNVADGASVNDSFNYTVKCSWLGDFNNDGLPELAVGRLPARSAQEATAMVTKIIGYESTSPSGEMLLVADANDGFDFEGADAELKALIPSNLRVNEIKRGSLEIGTARSLLFDAINRGQKIVNYTGHGSVDIWRANLLTSEDARLMENTTHLSLFIIMTCLNGYTQEPALDSIAKALVKSEGGAVAVWSSSGMTQPDEQAAMNRQLYRMLFGAGGQSMTLGDLTVRAKSAIADQDIRRTWILIGDPTMKIR